MKTRTKLLCTSFMLSFLILFSGSTCLAGQSADAREIARQAIQESMKQLSIAKSDTGVLLLTNAYYGRVNGRDAEPYRDLLSEMTGCTSGKRSLLDVYTPFKESLWFALFRKSSNTLLFYRWNGASFEKQAIDATPEKILEVQAWKRASEGPIGRKNLFQVLSIALAW